MEFLVIFKALFAVIGQLCHIVKKRQEDGASEIATFRKWVLQRPVNTIIAAIAGISGAFLLPQEGMIALGGGAPSSAEYVIKVLCMAFIAGFSADSLINRPGKSGSK